MRTIVEIPAFTKQAENLWREDEYEDFTFWLSKNPDAGEIVPGSGGWRKVRWSRSGSGKSGGVRVIYYHLAAAGQIVLAAVYAKAKRENMPAHEIRKRVE